MNDSWLQSLHGQPCHHGEGRFNYLSTISLSCTNAGVHDL
jgi:hypothetical protein